VNLVAAAGGRRSPPNEIPIASRPCPSLAELITAIAAMGSVDRPRRRRPLQGRGGALHLRQLRGRKPPTSSPYAPPPPRQHRPKQGPAACRSANPLLHFRRASARHDPSDANAIWHAPSAKPRSQDPGASNPQRPKSFGTASSRPPGATRIPASFQEAVTATVDGADGRRRASSICRQEAIQDEFLLHLQIRLVEQNKQIVLSPPGRSRPANLQDMKGKRNALAARQLALSPDIHSSDL